MYAPPVPHGAVRHNLVVAGGCAFPEWMPEDVKASCARLAQEADMDVLGAKLYLDETGEWCFAGATATPFLMLGGTALLERMATMLQQGGTA
jgi:hypothetical protein